MIADNYCGAFWQWCAEHPKAPPAEIRRIALLLLRIADREIDKGRRK